MEKAAFFRRVREAHHVHLVRPGKTRSTLDVPLAWGVLVAEVLAGFAQEDPLRPREAFDALAVDLVQQPVQALAQFLLALAVALHAAHLLAEQPAGSGRLQA